MDNVFILGLILIIILCIVIVLNSKTRQFFYTTPEEELVWNSGYVEGEKVVSKNGVSFYKITHYYQKSVGQFKNQIKTDINNILGDRYLFVVVNFKQLEEETENGETHKMEMKKYG